MAGNDSGKQSYIPIPFHQLSLELYQGNMSFLDGMPPALKRALIYIAHHYQHPLRLDDVAEKAFISSSHLSYLFRRHLGLRFKAVLTELRLRHAAYLIQENSAAMITDVSLESGFFDLSHFEKVFRRYFGVSPRDYRRIIRDEQSRKNRIRMTQTEQASYYPSFYDQAPTSGNMAESSHSRANAGASC